MLQVNNRNVHCTLHVRKNCKEKVCYNGKVFTQNNLQHQTSNARRNVIQGHFQAIYNDGLTYKTEIHIMQQATTRYHQHSTASF